MTNASQIECIEKDPVGPAFQSMPIMARRRRGALPTSRFRGSGSPFPEPHQGACLRENGSGPRQRRARRSGQAKGSIICQVCEEIATGKYLGEFPLDVFQGGAGTSTNMNINEVIANRGLEIMGLPRGRYDQLHLNNDVNFAQSTNDVYPTAIRLAILLSCGALQRALEQLASELEAKAENFSGVIKLGRTQLQDAVPMTLGQEFQAFATTLWEDVARLGEIASFFHEINLGGTAIGTGINTNPDYQRAAVAEFRAVAGLPIVSAGNLIKACRDTGAFVLFSGMLKRTATSTLENLQRSAAAFQRRAWRPERINLPALQPGSSITPGKVNPVTPKVANQVAFQIIDYDLTTTLASEAGQLHLNVMEPLIAYNILHSLELVTNAVDVLRTSASWALQPMQRHAANTSKPAPPWQQL